MANPRFIVVGGGLAGLANVIKLAEAGYDVDLFSLVPVKRSHSVCAQGGINGAVNTKGEGDHPDIHFYDSVYGGDYLANQPPIKSMCYAAPGIIYLLDRMGVMFNRTAEGLLDFRRFGGTMHHRTAHAGATTGQQLLYALDEQVRRYEVAGKVKKYEYWEFLGIVRDDEGICRGIVAKDLSSMEIKSFRGDAVMLATGGPGLIFGRSTNSLINTGTAAASAYIQGALYANGEFIQIHPTAIPGHDKLRLMSESARGEGGRVWVPKNKDEKRRGKDIPEDERDYFLERKYPKYKNLVPRDVATREIFNICRFEKRGIDGEDKVYLDLTHIPAAKLDAKLGGILEIYEKFMGDDPRHVPMMVFPAVHYSMGGLWVDYEKDSTGLLMKEASPRNQMTSIPGLYASGEADYQYHGANRLGANSLVSCIFAGFVAGPAMISYSKGLSKSSQDSPESLFTQETQKWSERFERIGRMDGNENPYRLHQELGDLMTENCTVVRYNDRLKETDVKLQEFMDRWHRINVLDTGKNMNQAKLFVNHLWNMLELSRVIALGALNRNESRGAHYKPDFPERDDVNWMKTSLAKHSKDGPIFSYEAIDATELTPKKRSYT